MLTRSSVADWTELDQTTDPAAFVGYLDAVSSQGAVQAYKQQTYTLLGVQPGDRVLDAGCGTGDDARAIAALVAPGGCVVGIDSSETMIDAARSRSRDNGVPVEFRTGDAHHLAFADGAFDAARADRVFQHLDDPQRALAELIRVTRPGGRIVVADTDWGTLTIDGPDPETTRAVLGTVATAIRNAWMGRKLFALFHRAGLVGVTVTAGTAVITSYAQANQLFHIEEGVRRARERRAITGKQAAHWSDWLAETDAAGRFSCSISGFIVAARRR